MIDPGRLRDLIYAHDGDDADLPFWEGCEGGQFLLMRCDACGRHVWPAAHCPHHGGGSMRWGPASGRGHVHVHTVMRRGHSAATGTAAPYVVAVVALAEGPFFHTNIVGIDADDVVSGLPVQLEFARHANGMTVPVFRADAIDPDLTGLDRQDIVA